MNSKDSRDCVGNGSNGKETIRRPRETQSDSILLSKEMLGRSLRKAFAAFLALAGALLSQPAGAEERLIKGFDAVRACSRDIEKFCSGVERWKFRTKVLDADLRVTPPSGRLAIIMQDEFRNTYDSCGPY